MAEVPVERRRPSGAVTLMVLGGAPLISLLTLAAGGSLNQQVPGFPAPGNLVAWGLPASQALRDAAAAITLGFLVLAVFCAPGSTGPDKRDLGDLATRLVRRAGLAAWVWAWATVLLIAFSYSDAAGLPLDTPGSTSQVLYFASGFELGRLLTTSLALTVWVALICALTPTVMGALLTLAVAAAALWPLASTGHAAGASFHGLAVDAQFAHMISASVWVGGLVGLVSLARVAAPELPAMAARYSRLALFCFGLLALSGFASVFTRLTSWSMLFTSYGAILTLKVAGFALLGLFGWWHRRKGLSGIAGGEPHAFARMATLEAALMAATVGLAVALSRTGVPEPPGGTEIVSTARSLLGFDPPPPLDASGLLARWLVDTGWGPVAIGAAAVYAWGVIRLRRAGNHWPLGRTVAWMIGCLLLTWAVLGAPGAYGRVTFSMHMVQHMTIATAVPTFLVLGAPVSLALRTLRRRQDGSFGPRELLLATVHSRWMKVVGHPAVAAALFIVSLYAFYYGGLFELTLRSHTMHNLMIVHFLITGYLFASSIVGIDPGPRRLAYPFRGVLLMATFGLHAFFSVSLMANTSVLASDWYFIVNPSSVESLADDQYLGASLGWALGDYPLALLGIILIVQWVRADHREQRRFDRQADRDGDARLKEYNDYLAQAANRHDV